jgi:hypothetical protein
LTDTELQVWRRYGVVVVALLSGAVIFWTALRSSGSDWFISETHADVIYTGLRRFGQFPFFSFVFNGGAYFLQDPQSNLFSLAVPLILLAGPSVGLRLMMGLWGVLGILAFTVWLRRRVSLEAALVGAVANAMSLQILWKVAVGNDMFLWHLGLPALLWAVEKVVRDLTIQSALFFGLVLGLLLMGPTFHSFTYLFVPVVPVFVLFELVCQRPKLRQSLRIAALLLAGCMLAMLIASPKLASWLTFPMSRPVEDAGVISLRSTMRALFDYSATQHTVVDATRIKSGQLQVGGWGLEECTVALPPIATLLALVGALSPIWSRTKRSIAFFAFFLIACAVAVASSWPIWNTFRVLNGGNFRVAPRFLAVAAFGLAILVALGADAIFARWRRAALPVSFALAGLMLGSAVWWTCSAARFLGKSTEDTVHPRAMNPIALSNEQRATGAGLRTFTALTNTRGNLHAILGGVGYRDGFLIVGDKFRPRLWESKQPEPIVVRGADPGNVTVDHLHVRLKHLEPHAHVSLRILEPEFGLAVTTKPADASVVIRSQRSFLVVENRGNAPIDSVVLRAQLPISSFWFVASLVGLLGAVLALFTLRRLEVKGKPSAHNEVALASQ